MSNIESKISKKKAVTIILLACLACSLFTGIYVKATTPTTIQVISSGIFSGAPCYTVFIDNSVVYAKSASGELITSSADASTVLNAAFDAAQLTGGTVFIKHGTYTLTTPLTYELSAGQKYIKVVGEDDYGTIIDGMGVSGYAVQLLGSFGYITFEDLKIKGGMYTESGITNLNFERVWFYNSTYDLLHLTDGEIITIHNCKFAYGGTGGLVLTPESVSCDAVMISDSIFYGSRNAQINFTGTNTIVVRDSHISNCYIEPYTSYPGHGVYWYNVYDCSIIGCTIAGNAGGAHNLLNIDGDTPNYSYNNRVIGNSIWATSTGILYPGYFGDGCRSIIVMANRFKGSTNSIYIHGNVASSRFTDNQFTGTATVSPTGKNNVFENNNGYITSKTGSSTGTGSQQNIAHGLSVTPNRIFISPFNALANVTASADATNIYITAANGVVYYWMAEYRCG